jgi:hypothetical protein
MSCKRCEHFKPYGKVMIKMPNWFSQLLFHFQHVKGFCMDSSNPTFNEYAKSSGRGLGYKAYLFGTEGCKFKKNK